jgi:hypothetical protein
LVIGVLIAAVAATFSVYRLDGLTFKARSLQYSSASTQILVDSPSSVLGNLSQTFEPLSTRAAVYANFMASPAVLNLIGQQLGMSGEQIYAAGPVIANQPRVVQEPTALKRNVEITGESNPYRLNFESQINLPTINIYSQAPTTERAVALANAAAAGLNLYVTRLENTNKIPPASRVTIRQLGPANGAVVNGGISKALAAIVFILVFVLWCVIVLVASRFLENWRASAVLTSGGNNGSLTAEHGEGVAAQTVTPSGHAHTAEIPLGETLHPRDDDRVSVPTRSAR